MPRRLCLGTRSTILIAYNDAPKIRTRQLKRQWPERVRAIGSWGDLFTDATHHQLTGHRVDAPPDGAMHALAQLFHDDVLVDHLSSATVVGVLDGHLRLNDAAHDGRMVLLASGRGGVWVRMEWVR